MKPINERLERIETEEPVLIPGADGTTRTIQVKVPAWRDPKDGEIYLDADSVALLDKARARHLGVLAPQELAKLRQRLGLTQSEIAELLQIGEKTWSRWENGREVPSRSLNLLLLALYEGKIDLSWLRAKISDGKQPAAEPVLRARGWETLVQEQRTLLWLENKLLAQEDWSLALGEVFPQMMTHDLWIVADTGLRGHERAGSFFSGRCRAPAVTAFRYEEMPLGA